MANKPTVTLTFAGDNQKLSKAMAEVGSSAEQMGKKVRDTADDAKTAGAGFDALTEGADTVDTRAMGFRDTITGLQDSFKGLTDDSLSLGDRLFTLGAGVGDLASGVANLLGPALGSMMTWLAGTTAAQWALNVAQTAWNGITAASAAVMKVLNAAFISSPIGWVILLIGGLVAAFVILWNKSAAFRDFFIGVWNGIKTVVGGVVDWIVSAWNGVITFFSQLPGKITGFFNGLGDGIKNIFKGAVNVVVDLLNKGIGLINSLIHGINNVSGIVGIPAIPDIPRIPRLHTGGVVPGMLGSETMAILQAGERIVPRGQGGNGAGTVTFAGDVDSAFASAFMKLVDIGAIRFAA